MTPIVLEEGNLNDVEPHLLRHLKHLSIDWVLYDTREVFWPENRNKTIQFFSELPEGQVFYTHHTFDGFQMFELMIELFHSLKHKRFVVYMMNPILAEHICEFYDKIESSITPKKLYDLQSKAKTIEDCKNTTQAIYDHKVNINTKFLECLEAHTLIHLGEWEPTTVYYHTLQHIRDDQHE